MNISLINILFLALFIMFCLHWLSTLILCLKKQKEDRIFWLTIILVTCPAGQFYYRVRNNLPLFKFFKGGEDEEFI